MQHRKAHSPSYLVMSLALGCGLCATACVAPDGPDVESEATVAGATDTEDGGEPILGMGELQAGEQDNTVHKLPFVDGFDSAETFLQLLPEPTPQGENVAVHMLLPPTHNQELGQSLIRIVGEGKHPIVLYRTDALVELGQLEDSPGPEFFTAFLLIDEDEIDRRKAIEAAFAEGEGRSETTVRFLGRTPVELTTGVKLDIQAFMGGGMVALGPCPVTPISELARWEESLMITDLEVVENPDRTHDNCMGGNPDGIWTFKHFMEEMATGSGMSTSDFVVDWLSNWLNDYTVNNDVVDARVDMFTQVIQPWATASGVAANLLPGNILSLSGPLDLDQAPFHLSAIVNRIDLGGTTSGGGGYGGPAVGSPTDAGELRFVFGVQDAGCGVMPFAVILEYGVPITGCGDVRDWAVEWTKLNDPTFAARFSDPWMDHLGTLTESVVVHGANPDKGNKNALNQLRTNENALDGQWELREFILGIEDPIADTNTPASGPLRRHTVAMTPDDAVYFPPPNSTINQFVNTDVLNSVPVSVMSLPGDCVSNYTVPGIFNSDPFRGGNALTSGAGPGFWSATVPMTARGLCARHEFSLNTCNGCHLDETATHFFHIDPQSSPAGLSDFLTGGPGIHQVPDPQFGSPIWEYADLERRFGRLYEIACDPCATKMGGLEVALALIDEVNGGGVPIDILDEEVQLPFEIAPVLNLEVVHKVLQNRGSFTDKNDVTSVEVGHFVRQAEHFVH